ncbi:nuclear transport factor 2 family protein [Streptomyces monticola]|uniref:Nuclear transport factor 2 family protein n=1 Tax=Streptomyces monticola TaxID=2666263 RepID=A0ABW2JZ33_9ACTN
MTTTAAGPLAEQVARLNLRAALSELVERYLASLDTGNFDDTWARSFFTEDIELTFPVGSHQGIAGLAGFTRAIMGRWESTHHHGSGCLVVPDGEDRAGVRWSLIASHMHFGSPRPPAVSRCFQLGGRFDGTARNTPQGWRFERLRLRITWSSGAPPTEVSSVDDATLGPALGLHTTTQLEDDAP